MQRNESKFTVYFEDPFWVGVFERICDGEVTACKITFGSEPKDYEVYEYLLRNWNKLSFSPPIKAEQRNEIQINPKRMQREINKQLESRGTGTKSQQALKLQHEEGKAARKEKSRMRRDEENQMKFDLHQQKRKEKHRGH